MKFNVQQEYCIVLQAYRTLHRNTHTEHQHSNEGMNVALKRTEGEFKIWMLVCEYGKQECWIAMQAYRTHTDECRM